MRVRCRFFATHFSRRFDAFANAGEDDEPGKKKSQTQIPLHFTDILDSVGNIQDFTPENQQDSVDKCSTYHSLFNSYSQNSTTESTGCSEAGSSVVVTFGLRSVT